MPTYYLLKHSDHTFSVYTSDNKTTLRRPTIREAVSSTLQTLPLGRRYGGNKPPPTRKELERSPNVKILYVSKSPIVYFFLRKNHPEIFL